MTALVSKSIEAPSLYVFGACTMQERVKKRVQRTSSSNVIEELGVQSVHQQEGLLSESSLILRYYDFTNNTTLSASAPWLADMATMCVLQKAVWILGTNLKLAFEHIVSTAITAESAPHTINSSSDVSQESIEQPYLRSTDHGEAAWLILARNLVIQSSIWIPH
ncbi:hypothetical protein N7G274_001817 [Stereocaulon virgatum]|uniref:Uncharacterized protein n=1 Tax=Stereocaulon virgatum TaxID=373712 RepID=A0ABR4AKS5_9LECA